MNLHSKKENSGELFDVLSTYRRFFAYGLFFSCIINVLMLVSPLYMMQVYNRAVMSRNLETLVMLTLIMLFLNLIMSAVETIRSMLLVRLGEKMDRRLNTRIFNAAYHRNLKMSGGNASQMLSDLAMLRQFLTGAGAFALFDLPWFPIYLGVVFMMHPWLGWISVFGALTLVVLTLLTEKITAPPLEESNREMAAANSLANTNLRNVEVIEAMGMIGGIRKRWMVKHKKCVELQSLASDRAGMIMALTKFIRVINSSMMIAVGAYLAMYEELSPAVMMVGGILGGRVMAPVEMVIGQWKMFVMARESYERLTDLLHTNPPKPKGLELPNPEGRVTIESLSAAPPGASKLVLHGLNFDVQPGEILGVIGPSASGKTTLARLLVGVWPASSGSVRLDGADIYAWDKEHLGPHMGYLPQDIELFQGTIAENIARLGALNSDWVTEAAIKAGVHEMILRLPNGYDTEIGVDGGVLSGGQRQRIGLARALYGNPCVVVLDEPNSNLDDAGDLALLNAIVSMKKDGKTVIIMTHRSTVLSVADKILYLRAGLQQAFGPRDQVFAMLNAPGVVQLHPGQVSEQRA